MLFGGGIALYVIRNVINNVVTSTSFGDNIVTYLVPLGILTATLIIIFRGKKKVR